MQEQSLSQQISARIRAAAGFGTPPEEVESAEQEQQTDFDGGARQAAPGPVRMDDIIRRSAGYLT